MVADPTRETCAHPCSHPCVRTQPHSPEKGNGPRGRFHRGRCIIVAPSGVIEVRLGAYAAMHSVARGFTSSRLSLHWRSCSRRQSRTPIPARAPCPVAWARCLRDKCAMSAMATVFVSARMLIRVGGLKCASLTSTRLNLPPPKVRDRRPSWSSLRLAERRGVKQGAVATDGCGHMIG